ncbi:hypothetical protein KKA24_00470 [Patescibacteria group bacterium]|nr:hypothetical protein [Patescibacteria group bacterium]
MATKTELELEVIKLGKEKGLLEARLKTAEENKERLGEGKDEIIESLRSEAKSKIERNRGLVFLIKSASAYLASEAVSPLDKNLDGESGKDDWSSFCGLIESFSKDEEEALNTLGARLREVAKERNLIVSILDSLEIIPKEVICLDSCDQLAFIKHKMREMETLLKGSYDKKTADDLFRLKLITVSTGK